MTWLTDAELTTDKMKELAKRANKAIFTAKQAQRAAVPADLRDLMQTEVDYAALEMRTLASMHGAGMVSSETLLKTIAAGLQVPEGYLYPQVNRIIWPECYDPVVPWQAERAIHLPSANLWLPPSKDVVVGRMKLHGRMLVIDHGISAEDFWVETAERDMAPSGYALLGWDLETDAYSEAAYQQLYQGQFSHVDMQRTDLFAGPPRQYGASRPRPLDGFKIQGSASDVVAAMLDQVRNAPFSRAPDDSYLAAAVGQIGTTSGRFGCTKPNLSAQPRSNYEYAKQDAELMRGIYEASLAPMTVRITGVDQNGDYITEDIEVFTGEKAGP